MQRSLLEQKVINQQRPPFLAKDYQQDGADSQNQNQISEFFGNDESQPELDNMVNLRLRTKNSRAHSAITRPNTSIGARTSSKRNRNIVEQIQTRNGDVPDQGYIEVAVRNLTNVTNSIAKTRQS